MAVWQVKLRTTIPSTTVRSWKGWSGLPTLRRGLSELFGPEHFGWQGEDVLHWGDYDRHDAALWLEEEEEKILLVRLDLREDLGRLTPGLSDLLLASGLKLIYGDVRIEPSRESIVRIIRNSDASRFVDDPAGWLERPFGDLRKDQA